MACNKIAVDPPLGHDLIKSCKLSLENNGVTLLILSNQEKLKSFMPFYFGKLFALFFFLA